MQYGKLRMSGNDVVKRYDCLNLLASSAEEQVVDVTSLSANAGIWNSLRSHGDNFHRLLNNTVRKAGKRVRISVYPTPILIEETLMEFGIAL